MKWRIVFARSAEKDLRRLSAEARTRIGRAIRGLGEEAFPSGSKRLKGRDELRLRIGEYRVLYTLDHPEHLLTVSAVGHRRDVYR